MPLRQYRRRRERRSAAIAHAAHAEGAPIALRMPLFLLAIATALAAADFRSG